MASGVLGQAAITSASTGTGLVVYTCPASTLAVVNVNIASVSSSSQTFDLAIPDETDGTFDAVDTVEDDSTLASKSIVERTNIVLNAGRSIVVTASDSTGVVVNVWGIEEAV